MKVYSQPLQPDNTFSDTFVACCLSPTYYNRYVHGEYEPHYPMPAIPIVVTIDAEFVGIWKRGRGPVFYTDNYETVWY